jgi:hypothetical protein
MHFSLHEGYTPRFLRRFSEKQENFVRGNSKLQNPMFFVANTEERLPQNHPLRAIKRRARRLCRRAMTGAARRRWIGTPSLPIPVSGALIWSSFPPPVV